MADHKNTRLALRDLIIEWFTLSDIQSLCFDIDIKYENIAGETLDDKARELVQYCFRHGLLEDLLARCRQIRPHVTWPSFEPNTLEAGHQITSNASNSTLSFGRFPSSAVLRTEDQFVLLKARAGAIEDYMIDLVHEVLIDIDKFNLFIRSESDKLNKNKWEDFEQIFLRGVWFDDAHGSVLLIIDLLHDGKYQALMDEEDLRQAFYDGYAWYGDQLIGVDAKVYSVHSSSDYFFGLSDEYYRGERSPFLGDSVKFS